MPLTINLEELKSMCKDTLMEHLGIEFIEISEGRMVATMPVDHRTYQPQKRLHGGAIMALAETVGSAGSHVMVDGSRFIVLGVEINGSHVGNTNQPYVIAEGNLIHKGISSHVWDVRVTDKKGKLISLCRVTNRILPIKD